LQDGQQPGVCEQRYNAFERLLNRPKTPTEELTRLSLEDLGRLAEDLQAQLKRR